MNTRTFEDKPAVRERVPLLVGLMGPPGSGKTYSALRLATGIQRVSGGEIFVIDTEARRALHYAERFRFRHLPFVAPFGSLDYAAAIDHCAGKGAGVIIVDSMSHEHEGEGGYLEYADAEKQRMGGGNNVKLASFIKPSQARRRMINRVLQMNVNFIFCFRAKEKVKPEKDGGKTEINSLGFMPIAGTELVFEMTACGLLLPRANGVPTWQSDFPGERLMMKMPEQFMELFKEEQPLSEDIGQAMAEWAKGAPSASQPAAGPTPNRPDGWDSWTLEEQGDNRAIAGVSELQAWWRTLPAADQKRLKAKLDNEWKPLASQQAELPGVAR